MYNFNAHKVVYSIALTTRIELFWHALVLFIRPEIELARGAEYVFNEFGHFFVLFCVCARKLKAFIVYRLNYMVHI